MIPRHVVGAAVPEGRHDYFGRTPQSDSFLSLLHNSRDVTFQNRTGMHLPLFSRVFGGDICRLPHFFSFHQVLGEEEERADRKTVQFNVRSGYRYEVLSLYLHKLLISSYHQNLSGKSLWKCHHQQLTGGSNSPPWPFMVNVSWRPWKICPAHT